MPEPVVITGPASEPAGPSEDEFEAAADHVGAQPDESPGSDSGEKSLLWSTLALAVTGPFWLLVYALQAVAKMVLSVAERYPRHSLAAAASVVILGAISYTQMPPRQGRHGLVATQIKGGSDASAANDAKNTADPRSSGPTATPGPAIAAGDENSGAAKPVDTVAANSEAAAKAASSAPAPTANDDAPPPLPSLTDATSAAKTTEPAPGKAEVSTELAAAKMEPAPRSAAAPDPATPTLLAGAAPEPAPSPSSPVVKDDKGNGDALTPPPAMEAPAAMALAAPLNLPGDPAPSPAPAGDPLQLATKLEPAGDPNKLTQAPPAGLLDVKPKDEPAPTESKPALAALAGPIATDPPRELSPPTSAPEAPKTESIQPESTKTETPKIPDPVPAAQPPATVAAGSAKPPADAGEPRLDVPSGGTQTIVSQPAMAAALPVAAAAAAAVTARSLTADPKPLETPGPEAKPAQPEDNPHASATVKEGQNRSTPPASANAATDGWVTVPNSGKFPVESVQDADTRSGDASPVGEAASPAFRDDRAHAAKDASFEPESPRSTASAPLDQNGSRLAAGAGGAAAAASKSTTGRVDAVPHVVERNENFWTISRLYYSSGRYYRALWKANIDTHPNIRKIKINDVIVIPPVEDLDPAYIDPPRGRAPADLTGASRPSDAQASGRSRDVAADLAESSVSSSVAAREEPFSTPSTNRSTVAGVPVRRSSRTDPDLDLPAPDVVSRKSRAPDRTGRRVDRPIGDDTTSEEPATRTAARPSPGATKRPAYKVRQFDSLRSIARDMLGDSHRASEILDLNRSSIDDPSHLIVGQMIELPDDARTSVRR
jgi:nucleoid-associated protein YgaU